MELVYLWIENYKNIQNQGFSFSPRFTCSFDKEKNELTIKANKEYQSIFPNNINVTAIVGENGSGKSSILEAIKLLTITTNTSFSLPYIKVFIKNNELIPVGSICDVKINNDLKYSYIPAFPFRDKSIDKKKVEIKNEINSQIYLYKYSLDVDEKSIVNYPNKNLSIEQISLEDKKLIIEYINNNNKNHKNYFGNYFNPNQCEVRLNRNTVASIHKLREKYKKIPKRNKEHPFIWDIYQYIMTIIDAESFNNVFRDIETSDELKKFINNYLKGEREYNRRLIQHEIERKKSNIEYIRKLLKYIDKLGKLDNLSGNIKSETSFNSSFLIETTFLLGKFFILEKLPDCFEIDFTDTTNNKKYNNLSSGEKSILRIRFYIENIIQKSDKENYIILLDEVETDLHPKWQKKLIDYLLDIFKTKKQTFHFIFTSHSPFMISDLPKENIIFLKEGKQVYPNIETFGANIHTLLSHGFFMDGGLMGEFAKGQINSAITMLNKSHLNEEDMKFCENIISITGEPLLKRQMQKMLDSKKAK